MTLAPRAPRVTFPLAVWTSYRSMLTLLVRGSYCTTPWSLGLRGPGQNTYGTGGRKSVVYGLCGVPEASYWPQSLIPLTKAKTKPAYSP